jgi:hypothetical protein
MTWSTVGTVVATVGASAVVAALVSSRHEAREAMRNRKVGAASSFLEAILEAVQALHAADEGLWHPEPNDVTDMPETTRLISKERPRQVPMNGFTAAIQNVVRALDVALARVTILELMFGGFSPDDVPPRARNLVAAIDARRRRLLELADPWPTTAKEAEAFMARIKAEDAAADADPHSVAGGWKAIDVQTSEFSNAARHATFGWWGP